MANIYNASTSIDKLEQLAMNDSPIHRMHPMAKIIVSIVYIVTVISFEPLNISGLIPFIFYPIITMSISSTPYSVLFERLLVALPFSLMGGISNLILSRTIVFYIGHFAISYGMVSFFSIMIKTLLCVLAILILISTTSFIEISYQLTVLHMPKILCLQLVMTYRYLSILSDSALSMFTSYSIRSPNQNGIKMKDMGSFLGQLILRSFDRAERIYQAMKCRGFHGVYYSKKHARFAFTDTIILLLSVSAIIFLRFFNLSLFFGKLVS